MTGLYLLGIAYEILRLRPNAAEGTMTSTKDD